MKSNRSFLLVLIALMHLAVAGCDGGGESDEAVVAAPLDPATLTDAQLGEAVEAEFLVFATADPVQAARLDKALLERHLKSGDGGSRDFFLMIKDLGGFTAFDQLIATKDHAGIEAVLSRYGIGYGTVEPSHEEPGNEQPGSEAPGSASSDK